MVIFEVFHILAAFLTQLCGNQNIDEDVRGITEAEDHLVQPLTPPSSSQRSSGFEFEVFLSFRGEDTKKGFTGHLYDTLQDRGVSTFIDNENLKRGEKVDKLFEYMEKSQICVPIISEHYAESKWCLREVTRSIECDMKIIPVFFGVEPSDVCNQSGPFKYAFKQHESNKKLKQEEVRKWREALMKVGKTSGFNLKDKNGDETNLKHTVVEEVLDIVNKKPLVVAKHPIGIETRVQEVKKMLENGDKGVDVIGIHGMGGLGKTTIARAVYNELAKGFDGKTCFLSNVRETAKLTNGLATLQKQIFQDILKDQNICLSDVALGASLIKGRVSRKRALLVIDDVDSVEQLNALAGGTDWFGSGSVIIITTRDEHVLLAHNVKEDKIYKPQELNEAQSRELFMLHAFHGKQQQQQQEYVELANEVVGVAGGLPLTLEVVGSLLSSKRNVQEWKDTLEKLKKIPSKEVQQRLRISYDSLDEMEKKIFLDISYLFLRSTRDYEYATYMWEGCGWFPNTTIRVLMQRSLIKIHEGKYATGLVFDMHDQIRDMGRAIVEEECSGMFQKKSRLMIHSQDSLDLLSRKAPMTIKAEGILIIPNHEMYRDEKYFVSTNWFEENMPNLRYLSASNVNFQGKSSGFPPNLKWLELWNCNFDSMPSEFNMEKLIILDLWKTNIAQVFINQIRLKGKAFEKLKVLAINGVETNVTLDFTNILSLEHLILESCPVLIDESIGNLKNLRELSIKHNNNLENLPESIGKLTSLKKLLVIGCERLSRLPDSICQLSSLEELDLSDSDRIYYLPEHIGHMESLKNLKLSFTGIEVLPDSICQLKLLECLDVSSCIEFYYLPERVGEMEKLRELILNSTKIKSIPDSVERLKNLCRLSLKGCNDLEALPNSIINFIVKTSDNSQIDFVCPHSLLLGLNDEFLKALRNMQLKDTTIEELSDCVGRMENLNKLLIECELLQELPNGISSLKLLQSLTLKSKSLKALPDNIGSLQQLSELTLKCKSLEALPNSIGSLKKLQRLTLECENLKALSDSIGLLQQLWSLTLKCENLKALPDNISSLKQLENLTLKCENLKVLPDNIWSLQQLRWLSLECENLKALPHNIWSLQQLRWLSLKCENLKALPDNIGLLQQLQCLTLKSKNLKALLDSIGSLQLLPDLTLECENLEALPDSIGLLKMMHSFTLNCMNLKALPDSIGELKNITTLQIENSKWQALPDSIALLTLGTLVHLSLWDCENLEALTSFAHLSCLQSLHLRDCHRLEYIPLLPSSLLSLKAFRCTKLATISDLSYLKTLENLNLGGCQLLEDLPGLEHISHNLQALELPGPCDLIRWSHLNQDFMINKVLEKKEVRFPNLLRFGMSGSLATKGSATGKQRLHFVLPRLPFIWLRRAWLTLRLDKVVPPIHAFIMDDETILLEKIVEVVKDGKVELNLREERFLNIVEGAEEHCYTMQVIVDVSQLQNVSVILAQTRSWIYDEDLWW